jgi:hypothetical protein
MARNYSLQSYTQALVCLFACLLACLLACLRGHCHSLGLVTGSQDLGICHSAWCPTCPASPHPHFKSEKEVARQPYQPPSGYSVLSLSPLTPSVLILWPPGWVLSKQMKETGAETNWGAGQWLPSAGAIQDQPQREMTDCQPPSAST